MCHNSCIFFGKKVLKDSEIKGKNVIDIGSRNVNGSLRFYIESLGCREYIGIDIKKGMGVDIICNAENIIDIFGNESFDIVISTELLEHAKDWKKVVSNIKNICKRGGIILLTTRSYGFPRYEYPYDYWRFEIADMMEIFSDCKIEILEKDPEMPGVFIKIKKDFSFTEKDLSDYELFEINANKRIKAHIKYKDIDKKLKVLIGIPTYNGTHRLDWLLYSIFKTANFIKNIEYKIIVCDDSGKNEWQQKTKDVINKWSSRLPISLLINHKNMGIAKSWNNIIRSDDSQYIILINDDIIVTNDWLENMMFFLYNNPNSGAAFYNFIKMDENDIQILLSKNYQKFVDKFQVDNSIPTYPVRCMHYIGCFFGFTRDKYNKVGGFDENYFINFEETDFCTSLASLGYPSYLLTHPICIHTYSASIKSSPEINYDIEFEKSSQYYTKKWTGDRNFTCNRYMSKVPFQRVKWLYNKIPYENILTDNYGYFEIELNNNGIKILNN